MRLTDGRTCLMGGMTDKQLTRLTYGRRCCVGGMTDRQSSHVDGMTDRQWT